MKQRILKLTAVGLALLLGVAASQGQTKTLAISSIPFDFQVGAQHMTAGRYLVVSEGGVVLRIQGANTPDTAMVLTGSIHSTQPGQEQPRLVFVSLGDQHYLTQIWSLDREDGRSIELPTRVEMEVKNGGGHETAIVASRD